MFRANIRRLLAIDDPPERTALAFSIGVFIAFFPLLGLHAVLATVIAFAFRFNKLAIYTGTFVNNPFLTLVPIILVSYGLGAVVIGRPLALPSESMELLKSPHLFTGDWWGNLFKTSGNLLWPYAIGGLLLSVICSLVAYPLTLRFLRAKQKIKSRRQNEKQNPESRIQNPE
ncbi:MAG: uncharacterized protein QOC96_2714 [Acidobacteriota bacterium]|jgi:uncharacterized protein (DUF2062 family)|nr:uncharacterized protein [Acidobacteriota bacterium]